MMLWETVKSPVVAGDSREGATDRWSTEMTRALKTLCMILLRRTRVTVQVSEPVECTPPRENPKEVVNFIDNNVSVLVRQHCYTCN